MTTSAQCLLPPALQLARDKPIVGIEAVELTLGQCRHVPLPLELTFGAGA